MSARAPMGWLGCSNESQRRHDAMSLGCSLKNELSCLCPWPVTEVKGKTHVPELPGLDVAHEAACPACASSFLCIRTGHSTRYRRFRIVDIGKHFLRRHASARQSQFGMASRRLHLRISGHTDITVCHHRRQRTGLWHRHTEKRADRKSVV